jgi:hypothetical protein
MNKNNNEDTDDGGYASATSGGNPSQRHVDLLDLGHVTLSMLSEMTCIDTRNKIIDALINSTNFYCIKCDDERPMRRHILEGKLLACCIDCLLEDRISAIDYILGKNKH